MSLSDLSAAHIAAQAGSFEPQRANNGLIRFFDLAENDTGAQGHEIITLSLQSFPLPVTSVEAMVTNWLNESRKVAGTVSFEDMELQLKDFVDMKTARIMKLWHEKVYNPVTGAIGLARDYKKRGEVRLFAPNGTLERNYLVVGAWPTIFNPGQIDMTSAEPVLISCTISIDKVYASSQMAAVDLVGR